MPGPSIAGTALAVAAAIAVAATPVVRAQSGGDPPFIPPAVTRAALNDLFKSTNGASWTNNAGWGTDSDFCTWYGVSCVYTNHNITTDLKLANNNLQGPIPDSFGNLGDLKHVDMSNNKLSGPIPESVSTITQLINLDLSGNQLTGPLPKYIYNQKVNVTYPVGTVMRSLDLSYNQLSGDIPETWFGPPREGPFPPPNNLQAINLRYNKLTGDIPRSVASAYKMTTLLLSYNDMSGNITDSLLTTWLGTRKYCDLSGNKWGAVDKSVATACLH